jgi:hypothetical protein
LKKNGDIYIYMYIHTCIHEISQSILDFIYGSRHIFCFWGCTFDSRVWSQGFKDPGCQEWWVAGNITWSRDT